MEYGYFLFLSITGVLSDAKTPRSNIMFLVRTGKTNGLVARIVYAAFVGHPEPLLAFTMSKMVHAHLRFHPVDTKEALPQKSPENAKPLS